jgi:glycosyltransferase involved in cell wall biosynthesis
MKIGIYNPYLDSFGGGERYTFTLAEHWSQHHSVSVFWGETDIVTRAQQRFGLDLSKVNVVPNVFRSHILKKILVTRSYDCIFIVSDGSVPTSFAKRNILHFQVPFPAVTMSPRKSRYYQAIVCNSEFTKKFLDPALSVPKVVIYPPVDTDVITDAKKKTNTILSVGRFSSLYAAKKHEVLIDAWKKARKKRGLASWKMVFAGSLLDSDKKYFQQLVSMAHGLSVEFHPNCTFNELLSMYSTARVYWHAAGFGEKKPERMEHFGITTVEAMAAGVVPIVFKGGGQPEIVQEGVNGYLFTTIEELVQKTVRLIEDKDLLYKIGTASYKRAREFSKSRFTESFDMLLTQL